jgi:hypothetical protein
LRVAQTGNAPGPGILDYADEMPHYVGGKNAMLAFFQKRLTYSSEAIAYLRTGDHLRQFCGG